MLKYNLYVNGVLMDKFKTLKEVENYIYEKGFYENNVDYVEIKKIKLGGIKKEENKKLKKNSIYKDKTEEIKNYINSLPTREHLFDSFIPGDVKYTILKILESEDKDA